MKIGLILLLVLGVIVVGGGFYLSRVEVPAPSSPQITVLDHEKYIQ